MGLIRAAFSAVGGTLADQWKEFFWCDSLDKDIIVARGEKKTTRRTSNYKGNDNVISNGSGIAVADGQCMIIVDQGKIAEVCAEPGEFIYNSSTEPSIFAGNLGESIGATFRAIGRRFTYGGDPARDQRVYYINTKELIDNKFGTPAPVPFRVVDKNIGLDVDITIRCNGVYSYKIANPLLFYTNVCGNVSEEYNRTELDGQLKSEFLNALQPAFAKISELGIRYSALPGHTVEMSDAMNAVLSSKWAGLRGISVVSVAINSVSAPKEDEDMIKELQRAAVLRNPNMAGATLASAQAEAMKAAASNPNGAMTGFMGFGMAQQAGGANAAAFYQMGAQQEAQKNSQPAPIGWDCPKCGNKNNTGKFCNECGSKKPEEKSDRSWDCAKCGHHGNSGKFCDECGSKKPGEEGWKCACGTINKGKFCSSCGAKRPSGAPVYKCDKCGWTPSDPQNPPKFCPECGDIFDANDTQK